MIAAAAGLSVAIATFVLFGWLSEAAAPPAVPPISLLALPFEAMLFILVGLRIAAAIPSDLRSGWAITSVGPLPGELRSGAWRVMFAFGVVSTTIVTAPIYWRWWGPVFALQHALVCLTLGAMLTEAFLFRFEGMPCGRPWRPEHANLRMLWPAYLAAFVTITIVLPTIERAVFLEPTGMAWLIGVLTAIAVVLRISHRRRRVVPDEDLDEPADVQVLNLN